MLEMEARVRKFLDQASCNDLKVQLNALKLSTSGTKAVLQLRLQEAWKNLPVDTLNEHVPADFGNERDESEDVSHSVAQMHNTTIAASNQDELSATDEEELDQELESLRRKVQKKREIAELKRKLQELTEADTAPASRSFIHFRDVEESLTAFSGDDNLPIDKWIKNFEESAEVLGWDSRMRFIYAKRLMTGTAKLLLRTVSVKSWEELKNVLFKEFRRNVSTADIHNELRRRRKKVCETWQQYIFAMQDIAALADVNESDVMCYIINGIPDTDINKMLLYGGVTRMRVSSVEL